jgi:Icc-related predicted phosphoesterase
MITEELGTLIEEWKTKNFEYVTREQSKKFRDEFENKTDNQDILAILKKIKEHMDYNGWEYTPVSEVKTTEELVEDTVTTEDTPEDTDSAGDLTDTGTPKKVVEKKGEKKEKPLTEEQKKQLKIEEMLKGNDDYKKIADEIKKAEKNLNTEITRRKTHIAKLKIKAKDKANMIFGDLYAKGNLK